MIELASKISTNEAKAIAFMADYTEKNLKVSLQWNDGSNNNWWPSLTILAKNPQKVVDKIQGDFGYLVTEETAKKCKEFIRLYSRNDNITFRYLTDTPLLDKYFRESVIAAFVASMGTITKNKVSVVYDKYERNSSKQGGYILDIALDADVADYSEETLVHYLTEYVAKRFPYFAHQAVQIYFNVKKLKSYVLIEVTAARKK